MSGDRPIQVLPISTWEIPCGIAEHTSYLRDALHQLRWPSPQVRLWDPDPAHLDPARYFDRQWRGVGLPEHDIVWLNYHAALHSRWEPHAITRLRSDEKKAVVVTYHDTGVPNSDQCRHLWTATLERRANPAVPAGAFIVHEPCADLPGAIYIRQGVLPAQPGVLFNRASHRRVVPPAPVDDIEEPGQTGLVGTHFARGRRPVVGTVGFPFPWKNYDLLCEASALAGWSVLLLAPRATDEQVATWRRLNPWSAIVRGFVPAESVVRYLTGCDATAFLYMCANTGTSGAIRQGLAARKPLIATAGCRQFRDLEEDQSWPRGIGIRWLSDLSVDGVAQALSALPIVTLDAGIQRIAERDSWHRVAIRYAGIFGGVLGHDGKYLPAPVPEARSNPAADSTMFRDGKVS